MDPLTVSALVSTAGNIFGSLLSAKGQKDANQQNANSAKAQMEFEERMSNTAHQREVADLRAAGLNPIISAHGGASSPGGAMSKAENPYENVAQNAINSAKVAADIELTKELAKTEKTKQAFNDAQTDQARGRISIPGIYSGPASNLKKLAESPTVKNFVQSRPDFLRTTPRFLRNPHSAAALSRIPQLSIQSKTLRQVA